jgi:hypothetical protein
LTYISFWAFILDSNIVFNSSGVFPMASAKTLRSIPFVKSSIRALASVSNFTLLSKVPLIAFNNGSYTSLLDLTNSLSVSTRFCY